LATNATKNVSLGGRLYLTNFRLVWVPSKFQNLTSEPLWEAALQQVKGAAKAPRSVAGFFSGGFQQRLAVRLDSGDQLFALYGVANWVRKIESAVKSN
jgi:hypothetical protein